MLTLEQEKKIEEVCDIIDAGHETPLSPMIYPLLIELAKNTRASGGGTRERWLKALRALGETCITVEKMSNRK